MSRLVFSTADLELIAERARGIEGATVAVHPAELMRSGDREVLAGTWVSITVAAGTISVFQEHVFTMASATTEAQSILESAKALHDVYVKVIP